jgi:hypothetical protein
MDVSNDEHSGLLSTGTMINNVADLLEVVLED